MANREPFPPAGTESVISLVSVGATLVAGRRTIGVFTTIAVVVGLLVALLRSPEYRASTSLLLASAESADLSQLRGLASQFGVNVGGGKSSQLTPDLVARLAISPQLLRNRAVDSLQLPELGPAKWEVGELLEVRKQSGTDPLGRERRLRKVMKALGTRISASSDKRLGTVTVTVDAPVPSLALQLLQSTVSDLDSALFSFGKQRASSERESIEGRLAIQEERLRQEEGKLASFLLRNRTYENSPELRFEYDRLQRAVALQQQVLLGMAQAREEVLSREVQSAPSLTVVEAPLPPVLPEPRKRGLIMMVSLIVGLFAGSLAVLAREILRSAWWKTAPIVDASRLQ